MLIINLEVYAILLFIIFVLNYPFCDEEFFYLFKNRDLNFWLVLLVLVLFLIINLVEFYYKLSINFLFIILFYLIILSDLISFFLFYEIVFILIIFTIILLGYSFERLIASYIIIFYSFIFSSPRLIILLIFDHSFLIKGWLYYSFLINYFFLGSFIVKFPIFGFHYWLPVAHVEASTVGSIILAGVLLKLGRLGLYYLINIIGFLVKLHWVAIRVLILILIILRLSDLKIIIAYSSVAHISIIFYVIMLGSFIGKKGCIVIIFYHGFISPLIFWLVGILVWWKTRSLIVVKILRFSYVFIFILFLMFILNIGFPPFIGFLREIYILKSLILNKFILRILILGVLFRCYYNIYLFWCFNGFIGLIYKANFFRLDLFIFLIFSLILNF